MLTPPPETRNPKPETRKPKTETRNRNPETRILRNDARKRNLEFETRNPSIVAFIEQIEVLGNAGPKLQIRNPNPETEIRNPKRQGPSLTSPSVKELHGGHVVYDPL